MTKKAGKKLYLLGEGYPWYPFGNTRISLAEKNFDRNWKSIDVTALKVVRKQKVKLWIERVG